MLMMHALIAFNGTFSSPIAPYRLNNVATIGRHLTRPSLKFFNVRHIMNAMASKANIKLARKF